MAVAQKDPGVTGRNGSGYRCLVPPFCGAGRMKRYKAFGAGGVFQLCQTRRFKHVQAILRAPMG
jgi:hypothetical protein